MFEYKWFVILINSKQRNNIKYKLQELIKQHDLSNIIIDIKTPSKLFLEQQENKSNIILKKINTHPGYLLLNIKTKKKKQYYIIPNSVFIILNSLNLRFLNLSSSSPVPLSKLEINKLLDIGDKVKPLNVKDTNYDFKLFDKIMILKTPFINLKGVIIKILKNNYFLIKTFFFSKEIMIEISKEYLSLIKKK